MELIATITAIILGPILAVQIQKFIEWHTEETRRKKYIFRALMANRGNLLHPDFVSALNLIHLDFSSKKPKEKEVIQAWDILLDNFVKYPKVEDYGEKYDAYQTDLKRAVERTQDLLTTLLEKMAIALNYNFDRLKIQNACYTPRGHEEVEEDIKLIRKGIIGLFSRNLSIDMNVKELPEQKPHPEILEILKQRNT